MMIPLKDLVLCLNLVLVIISKKISPIFVFETYGLINFGSVENKLSGEHFAPDIGNVKADFLRIGLQPSISYSQKHIVAAISSRIAHLNYNNISGTFS